MRVLACPTPTLNLTTLQEVVASLRDDVDYILEMIGPEPKTARVELVEDTILATLFTALVEPPRKPLLSQPETLP